MPTGAASSYGPETNVVDIVIIGAGLSGLVAAAYLKKEGIDSFIVVDEGAHGQASRCLTQSTAHPSRIAVRQRQLCHCTATRCVTLHTELSRDATYGQPLQPRRPLMPSLSPQSPATFERVTQRAWRRASLQAL